MGAKLRLNSHKTDMCIGRKNNFNCDIELPAEANFSNNVNFLGFKFDSRLSYTKQVSSVYRRCYYLLNINAHLVIINAHFLRASFLSLKQKKRRAERKYRKSKHLY